MSGVIKEEGDRISIKHLDITSEIKNPDCLRRISKDCRIIHGLYDLSIHYGKCFTILTCFIRQGRSNAGIDSLFLY